MNQDMSNIQKTLEKSRNDISEKLDNLSFDSAKDSLSSVSKQVRDNVQNVRENAQNVVENARESGDALTKAANQAVRDGIDQTRQANTSITQQTNSRLKEYSGFVKEHPLSATAAVFFVGFVIARWTR